MMLKLGFSNRWVNLKMKCITSIAYSIIINGCITDDFVHERGLRQEDPLSPYLFLICTEGLFALLSNVKENE